MSSLFKTIAELKTAVPVLKNVNDGSWEGTIETAEQHYLVKILGETLYNDLVAAHNPGPAAGVMANLLPYAQKVSGNMGVFEWLPLIYSQTSDAGERVTFTEHTERSPKWAFDMKRKALLDIAGKAIESLYRFLETNKSDYPDWDSAAHLGLFIRNADEFDKHISISRSRWTFTSMLPTMNDVEEMYIIPTLGQALYDDLKAKLEADAALSAEETTLLKKIRKPLALLTAGHALEDLDMIITPSGVMQRYERPVDGEYLQPADSGRVERYSKKIITRGNGFLHNVQVFLNNTATASVYPLYYNSDKFNPPVDPEAPTRIPDLGNKDRSGLYSF